MTFADHKAISFFLGCDFVPIKFDEKWAQYTEIVAMSPAQFMAFPISKASTQEVAAEFCRKLLLEQGLSARKMVVKARMWSQRSVNKERGLLAFKEERAVVEALGHKPYLDSLAGYIVREVGLKSKVKHQTLMDAKHAK